MQEMDSLTGREIAVIGMAGRFPGARNLSEFWENLRNGVEGVTFFTEEELLASGVAPETIRHPNYVASGSLLDNVDLFDASFFGYNAREAEILDPQQRLFLEVSWHALEDAGYDPLRYEGLIGVYAGAAWNTYLLSNLTTHLELFDGGGAFQVFIASDKDFMPTRVSYKLNLKGPGLIIQTSCSTSLVAVHVACLSLLNYECDIALAGGVTVKVPQQAGYFYQEGGLASPDGHCRAFDAKAAGTIFGSGVGVVALKRLSDALEDGDHIRAVVKGSAINNDGWAKVSYTAPSIDGQSQVIAAAQAMTGFEPETIRYVETHGTGTSLGDPIEVSALTKVFRKSTPRKSFCAIGSLKSNIGHLDAAAGIGGFIKTVLALENREIPPSINFEVPNPTIDFPETPFYVNSKLVQWESPDIPRRAAVSSFGVGGTNAHVILEEAPVSSSESSSRPWHLVTLSAKTATALETSTENLLTWLREHETASLPDVAYTLQVGRAVFRHRRVLVCSDRDDAIQAFESPERVRVLTAVDDEEPRDRPVVFLFPGQGSPYLRHAQGIYEGQSVFRKHFDECVRLLKPHLGLELLEVLYPPTGVDDAEASARIEQTSLAQPILFATEYALARLWMHWGVRPAAMLGHSIGEYVAACLAGVFSLEDALRLVAVRGRLMQEQPEGSMMAVALPEAELSSMLPPEISIAAVNEPASCVVSGPSGSMEKLVDELTRRDIGFRQLHTSHAFHSIMMEPMLEAFGRELRSVRLQPPHIPFVSSLTGTWITAEQATDPNYWVRQLRQPVRFSQGLRELLAEPERVFVEVGPGRTLTTLGARHAEARGRILVPSLRHVKEETPDEALILESLGRLWLAGIKIDWREFYEHERRSRIPLQLYPFERQRFWIEPRPRTAHGLGPAGEEIATVKKVNLSDWFYLPAWKPSLPRRPVEELPNNWLILRDEGEFATALATRLTTLGRKVVTVEIGERFSRRSETSYTIRPDSIEDYRSLLEELQGSELTPQTIVHAFSLTPVAATSPGIAGFEQAQHRGFYSLLALLQALSLHTSADIEINVVSNSVVATHATEVLHPEKSTMLGLCKVAMQESSNLTTRFIDVAFSDLSLPGVTRLLDSVMSELNAGHTEDVVAYRGRDRYVQSFEPVHPDDSPAPLREQGVYLITGGLTRNGFAVAKYLARTVKARLVLVEREAISDSDTADPRIQRLALLEELGADVCLVVADVADEAQFTRAWSEAETRFGVIHGVIHAEEPSGERAFRAIHEASREDCEWHFRLKAHALYALERVLKDREVDFCILLSSVASVLGGVGYGAYAAANQFMDSFVRSSNQTWLSLNCDLWLSEDSGEQLTDLLTDLSELAMTAREGEEIFRRALAVRTVGQLIVSTVDLPARLLATQKRFESLRARQKSGQATETVRHERPPLPNPYIAPETEMEQRIAAVWQQVLGFEEIGVEDNFFDLGGDSLVAIQVAARLKDALNMDFPVAKLYQALTVRSLAQVLTESEDEEQQRRAAEQAQRNQAATRRLQYIEHRKSRVRGAEV